MTAGSIRTAIVTERIAWIRKLLDGILLREGRRHSIFQKGHPKTEVPRHNEILDELARKICRDLDVPYTR